MQSAAAEIHERVPIRWYTLRTVLAGLWLVALAILYFPVVYPIAIAEVPPSDYRFSFYVIALIFAVDLGILAIDYIYKLFRPPKPPPPVGQLKAMDILGIGLRTGLALVVGGSYVTGAAISTPTVFSILQFLAGGGTIVILANYLHSLFASLIIGLGLAIVVFELTKIALHKQSWRDWLIKSRYPESKLFYWLLGLTLIVQGAIGVLLLGTISPYGPFGLVGNLPYSLETLLRHIHGPLGAVVWVLIANQIYLRLRPEFSIK